MEKDIKFKIISECLKSGISVTCRKHNISRTLYYRWLKRYKSKGMDGLDNIKKDFVPANKTNIEIENALLNLIKQYPSYGPKSIKYLFDELGYNLSESAIFNIMRRNNLTKKENRIKFAKKQEHKITTSIPTLTELNSGECWIFWVTDYGYYKNLGNIYEFTLYDLKSRIACTRLYNEISFNNFEDLLTASAMPVANTLNLKLKYLCLFRDSKILKQSVKSFKFNMSKIISDNGFNFKVHILLDNNDSLETINELRKKYTESCISFLMPLINDQLSFSELKIKFQGYVRNYNMNYKSIFDNEEYSPIEYHNKVTNTKLILPILAYIDRNY
ncbi:helix-turn-helix domain-containing protein [Clostridium sp.]|uniref:helix-turn-helix domain-containing protein n=1 Tax=Clostridium sp. TaxID=1506 RepID=UPI0026016966|nr:helix-turn-helix domain-containing protein [Clostridium sp.]